MAEETNLKKMPYKMKVEDIKKAGIKNLVTCDPLTKVSEVNQVASLDKTTHNAEHAVIPPIINFAN